MSKHLKLLKFYLVFAKYFCHLNLSYAKGKCLCLLPLNSQLILFVDILIISAHASNLLTAMRTQTSTTAASVVRKSRITCAFCSLLRTWVNGCGDAKEAAHKQIYHSTVS